ncbi:hypothetical protein BH10PSE17_BH10PSE17_23600 [soil metagenome]
MKKYAICLSLVLAACGVGGGGSDDVGTVTPAVPPVPVVAASPSGFYVGDTSDSSYHVALLVDESAKLWAVYTDAKTNSVFALVSGSVTYDGKALTGTGSTYEIGSVSPTSVDATYTAKSSLAGSIKSSVRTLTSTLAYDASYDTPITLADGFHDGVMTSLNNGTLYNLSAKFDGTKITADMACGCTFAGTVTPSGKGFATASITMDVGPTSLKELSGQTLTGVLVSVGDYYEVALKNDTNTAIATIVLKKATTTTPAVVLPK